MNTTQLPFDLLAWCRRMSSTDTPISAQEAADFLGISRAGYYAMERRNRVHGTASATIVKLATLLEEKRCA